MVWKTRTQLWLPDGEKIIFIRFDRTYERDGQTDRQTPHDDIGRVCIASRGKNEETKPSNGQVAGVQQAGLGLQRALNHACFTCSVAQCSLDWQAVLRHSV